NEEQKEVESIQYEDRSALLGRPTLHVDIGCYATMLWRGGFLGPLLDTFNNAGTEVVVDRSNVPNPESGWTVQLALLFLSSFLALNKEQHIDIQKLGRCTSHVAHRWQD